MAESLDLEDQFNDTEYNMQLRDMIVEINKLYDEVEQGRITQETANKTITSLIDDPRYSQVKLKKQIDERDQEILLRDNSKFNDTEYNIQLQDMIAEINKLKDDVENGRITQEAANKTITSITDDPRYNQIKLKKEIVEREHAFLLRNKRPPIPYEILNDTNSLSENTSPINFSSTTNTINLLSTTNTIYTYPDVSYMDSDSDGWGVGYNVATLHEATSSDPDEYMKIAARSEAVGSYYADGYMFTYFFAPDTGNAIVGVDFDWCGGCLYPDDCSIDFVLWELIWVGPQEVQWVKISEDEDAVSLTGLTATGGPYDASASCSTYLDYDAVLYCFALEAHTKGSSLVPFSPASGADFGFPAIGGTPRVTWHQGKVIY
ncbi:hypothetical protein [Methanosarcina sp. WWM596]|uniref:hypothetical protein n=1 Tax=Methanosarcina sp. WWM596 TaxID=1434103 RepID=UPI0012E0B387|nr:hypothetical protein [Methanosarcina sp. WWM596]